MLFSFKHVHQHSPGYNSFSTQLPKAKKSLIYSCLVTKPEITALELPDTRKWIKFNLDGCGLKVNFAALQIKPEFYRARFNKDPGNVLKIKEL